VVHDVLVAGRGGGDAMVDGRGSALKQ